MKYVFEFQVCQFEKSEEVQSFIKATEKYGISYESELLKAAYNPRTGNVDQWIQAWVSKEADAIILKAETGVPYAER